MKKLLLAALLGLSAVGAQAAEGAAGTGPNPYSDCGIGAALFGETKWAAVTSNVTWDLGTTALTSGTMSPNTCSGKQVKVAALISDTYAQLVEETAAGEGMHLASLLAVSECGTGQSAAAIAAIRAGVSESVAAESYASKSHVEKATDMYFAVQKATAANCTI